VTATQPGTGTFASVTTSATVTITGALPVVKKTITCVKGKKTVKKINMCHPRVFDNNNKKINN
jgi:hypothetical protein